MMDTDDGIRERHGVACRQGENSCSSITVHEGERMIYIDGQIYTRSLTPYQARYLASKLYRLSRRIRTRTEAA